MTAPQKESHIEHNSEINTWDWT